MNGTFEYRTIEKVQKLRAKDVCEGEHKRKSSVRL